MSVGEKERAPSSRRAASASSPRSIAALACMYACSALLQSASSNARTSGCCGSSACARRISALPMDWCPAPAPLAASCHRSFARSTK